MDTTTNTLRPCTETNCVEVAHDESEEFLHDRASIVGDGYALTVHRVSDSSVWEIDVQSAPEMTADQAESFAVDLMRAAADCRTLNTA